MKTEKFPIPVVGPLIYNDKNELFLAQSNGKFGDQWVIPGGKISWGESMEEALRREIKEETNLDISDIEFIGTDEYITEDKHFILINFKVTTDGNQSVILNEEHKNYGWFTKEQIQSLDIAEITQELLRKESIIEV